jgi:hypothetical protein
LKHATHLHMIFTQNSRSKRSVSSFVCPQILSAIWVNGFRLSLVLLIKNNSLRWLSFGILRRVVR